MAAKLLDLKRLMKAVDNKDYSFYDSLSTEDKKAFAPYLALRWTPSVSGAPDLQAYYMLATNERVNKNFWEIGKQHHKLCWLSIVSASPGMGAQFHYWVAMDKKKKGDKLRNKIAELFPAMKNDEIDLIISVNTTDEIASWLKDNGFDNKEVAAFLK